MSDYIAVDERLRKDVLDANGVKEVWEGSHHYAVGVKMTVRQMRVLQEKRKVKC